MKTHELLPDQAFRLTTSEDEPTKFLGLFRDCWARIPSADRDAMVEFWCALDHGPVIELSDCWGDAKTSFAQVTGAGTKMRFSASDFAVLPATVSTWIIAHELAHVYQKAVGRKPGGDGERTNEDEADDIAKNWGFDHMPRVILGLLMGGDYSFEEACKEVRRICQKNAPRTGSPSPGGH